MAEIINPGGKDAGRKDLPSPLTIEGKMSSIGNVHGIRQRRGKPALFTSTDRSSESFFGEAAQDNPNGYLVGIGAGSIFPMLRLFSQEPKGFIAADVYPDIVIAGRVMVEELKSAPDYTSFARNFFGASKTDYDKKMVGAMRGDLRFVTSYVGWKGEIGKPMDPIPSPEDLPIDTIDVREAIATHFDLLKSMALKGKIAFCLTDFADPEFLRAVSGLPDFRTNRNVIFLTNFLNFRYGNGYLAPIENIGLLDTPANDGLFIAAPYQWSGHVRPYHGFTNLLRAHRIDPEDLPAPKV